MEEGGYENTTLTLKIYMSGMGPIETMAISDMMNSFNLKMHDDSDSDREVARIVM